MLRGFFSAFSIKFTSSFMLKPSSVRNGPSTFIYKSVRSQQNANFTSLVPGISPAIIASQWISNCSKTIFSKPHNVSFGQIRTITKFSWKTGKRKTAKSIPKRFFRLHWGIWIRTIAGRHQRLWRKSGSRRNELLNHVFCNATQCRMLDAMVNKFWRKPKFYIDDPYQPYHERENYYITKRKPWRPEGADYE